MHKKNTSPTRQGRVGKLRFVLYPLAALAVAAAAAMAFAFPAEKAASPDASRIAQPSAAALELADNTPGEPAGRRDTESAKDAGALSGATVATPEYTADWKLLLVNPWNAVPQGHSVTLTQLDNGQAVDKRCYADLQAMMDDCRAQGLSPLICSSYRSQEDQQALFDKKAGRLAGQGYAIEEAVNQAAKSVALPGTSEHQLGLAVDVVDTGNQNLDQSQEDTEVQKWLMANSWSYGFILRYPNGKSDTTGIIYEPWHYRYVGKEAAKEIYDQGICLEEYLYRQGV